MIYTSTTIYSSFVIYKYFGLQILGEGEGEGVIERF